MQREKIKMFNNLVYSDIGANKSKNKNAEQAMIAKSPREVSQPIHKNMRKKSIAITPGPGDYSP